MSKLRVESYTISIDGFGAGADQSLENPLGVGGTSLHEWLFSTRTIQSNLFGKDDGETGIDDNFAARGFHNVGAWISRHYTRDDVTHATSHRSRCARGAACDGGGGCANPFL